jgi:hypothetical protein
MKVYLAKFEKNGKTAYKTGHTKWFKSGKRFADEQYDIFDKVTILDDIYISHDDARVARKMSEAVEACLHAFFPKNFHLEPYFVTEDKAFEGLSGITEMFILSEGWSEDQVLEIFRRVKRNVGFVLK